eukprot:7148-Pelagococcus_subviridis.AAC.1
MDPRPSSAREGREATAGRAHRRHQGLGTGSEPRARRGDRRDEAQEQRGAGRGVRERAGEREGAEFRCVLYKHDEDDESDDDDDGDGGDE